ncbi:MAG: polyprenyl synthetase family protein [Pirellulales bacterium]
MNQSMPVTSSTLADQLRQLRQQIDLALDRYSVIEEGCPDDLGEAIRYSLLAPGKRLRPILVLLAAEACGCPSERALPAACAIEMVHCYSLIHDDLPAMDDDDLRRGRPSCHRQFNEAIAILAGDALLTRAFELLATETHPPQLAARCCAELAKAAGARQLIGGQADDLRGVEGKQHIDRLKAIHQRKTGAMFLASLRMGGMIAEASTNQLVSLVEYGAKLGLAFQVVDDLLDVGGDEARLGKRVGKDAGRGKMTFPGLLGVDASRDLVKRLVDDACHAIAPLAPRQTTLEALARYVAERDR